MSSDMHLAVFWISVAVFGAIALNSLALVLR
jgi:hypothetical protein